MTNTSLQVSWLAQQMAADSRAFATLLNQPSDPFEAFRDTLREELEEARIAHENQYLNTQADER